MKKLQLNLYLGVLIGAITFAVFVMIWILFRNDTTNISKAEQIQKDIFSVVRDEGIVNTFFWEQKDGKEFVCISRSVENENKEKNLIFHIYDESGVLIFQEDFGRFGQINKIYSIFALRTSSPQLAIEINKGGSISILYLLDYNNGKIRNLINSNEGDFDIICEIKPQFESVTEMRKLPFQIFLTSQIASFSEAETKIFSFKDGKYSYEGKYKISKVEKYAKKILEK